MQVLVTAAAPSSCLRPDSETSQTPRRTKYASVRVILLLNYKAEKPRLQTRWGNLRLVGEIRRDLFLDGVGLITLGKGLIRSAEPANTLSLLLSAGAK